MTQTALIIGATGGIGGETARALGRRGWRIRALTRYPEKARRSASGLGAVDWVGGDAMNREDVVTAAQGADLIVHAANPPGYRNWAGLAMPMLDSTIAAARESGARIVFPGTIYNYGPDAFPLLSEDSPQRPLTRKGAIRVAMEARLAAAAEDGVRTLIVRAGDFFGPRTGNSWFSDGMIRPGRPVRSVWHPGRPGVGHAWAYLPDVAETMAQLVEREDGLAAFDSFHFAGHWFDDGIGMPQAIARAAGNPELPIRRFPWWAMTVASPFVNLAHEMAEIRYCWQQPIRLDNRKLTALLGSEPRTPLDEAVKASLTGLGCLPDTGATAAAIAARA